MTGVPAITWGSTDNGSSSGGVEPMPGGRSFNKPDGRAENEIHLRIQLRDTTGSRRNGSGLDMFYKLGLDANWTQLTISPLQRTDITTEELEVGIYQTSSALSTAIVDDFSIISETMLKASFE
jgi:hypothetical protein